MTKDLITAVRRIFPHRPSNDAQTRSSVSRGQDQSSNLSHDSEISQRALRALQLRYSAIYKAHIPMTSTCGIISHMRSAHTATNLVKLQHFVSSEI